MILDTHVDIRWPEPPDWTCESGMCVDLPRMRAGGVAGTVFIAFVPQGPRDFASLRAAQERAVAMLEHIRARADGATTHFCATPTEFEAAMRAGIPAVLSAVENGHAMGHDLGLIAKWRGLGAIYLTVTHDGHNALADAAKPKPHLGDGPSEHGGLSALGRAAIREMNRVGLMVDCSHVSKAGMMQAAELSRVPVAVTHTACAALHPHPRNVDDEQLDMIREVCGIAQVTAVASFLRPTGPDGTSPSTVEDVADHVEHAVRRIGIEHVGISSDFDGGGGVSGWMHAGEMQNVSAALRARGYGERELALLWSGNFLRVWRQVLRGAGA
ncbi:dipeptidase [Sabulicella rubraurantiaca]|uniref:dipeptidase n=1 Tax=Sabulicella rubraurantiaca TaxID=2811429 RepID=UPI002E2E6A0F|nr:dipeptidase [Sabulicella rubraurantiaca]